MSGLPKQCCATGSLHTGTPTGRVDKVHGLNCYIAEPPSGTPKGIVVIIPDIFGWELPNNRILADEYAKKGNFLVYLPDFMNDYDRNRDPREPSKLTRARTRPGYVVPGSLLNSVEAFLATGLIANLKKIYHLGLVLYWFGPFLYFNTPGVVRPRILTFFRGLASAAPTQPVGAAGFCWGGKYVVELCSDRHKTSPPVGQPTPQDAGQSGGTGKSLLVAGFAAHPSRLALPADIEAVEVPLSVAAASIDPQLPKDKAEMVRQVLEGKTAKGKDAGVEHEYVWYEGATHGFAVRANEDDKEEAERGKKAEQQAIDWFSKWFNAKAS
ncbi:hypothetical protein MBLNU459_g4409t1 [Dothideomycetes sp. NU459]